MEGHIDGFDCSKESRKPDGDLVHVSPGGLQYGADPKFGNRVDHVLDHTAPNPNKPVHSAFNAQGDDALDLVDQAWARRGAPDPNDAAAFAGVNPHYVDGAGPGVWGAGQSFECQLLRTGL